MGWTTPFTFVAVTTLTAGQLNANVRDNTNFLLNGKFVNTKNYLKLADYTLTTNAALGTILDQANLRITTPTSFASGRIQITVSLAAAIVATGTNTQDLAFDVLIDSGGANPFYLSVAMSNNGVATAGNPPNTGKGGLMALASQSSLGVGDITFSGIITGLGVGVAHTVDVVYSSAFTSGTGGNSATVYGTYTPIIISVLEL